MNFFNMNIFNMTKSRLQKRATSNVHHYHNYKVSVHQGPHIYASDPSFKVCEASRDIHKREAHNPTSVSTVLLSTQSKQVDPRIQRTWGHLPASGPNTEKRSTKKMRMSFPSYCVLPTQLAEMMLYMQSAFLHNDISKETKKY